MITTKVVTMQEIEQANTGAGGNWFSPGAMRSFRTRLPEFGEMITDGAARVYVWTSSERDDNGPRAYSVRVMFLTDDLRYVRTLGGLCAYKTAAQAKAAARREVDRRVAAGERFKEIDTQSEGNK
jgi:hypothetical protein